VRIVCFSDTHGYHKKVKIPHGDVLIYAGDYTYDQNDEVGQLTRFNKWLGKFSHDHKIMIAGNHDWLFERDHYHAASLVSNATYLNDSEAHVNGLKVWGSPITPAFNNWAFNRDRGEAIKRHWDMIPDDIDILVTHGPPRGILDEVEGDTGYWMDQGKRKARERHVGCDDLLAAICRLKNLKLHVFGHLHGSWGNEVHGGIRYVNCSCGYWWHGQRKPAIVVEI
jgi:Icc-related predicted phosphoesterase